jgi:hypothetical protein
MVITQNILRGGCMKKLVMKNSPLQKNSDNFPLCIFKILTWRIHSNRNHGHNAHTNNLKKKNNRSSCTCFQDRTLKVIL